MKQLKHRILCTLGKINFLGLRSKFAKKLAKCELNHVLLDIGSACNAKCPYCPRQYENEPFKGNGLMNEEVFNTVYEQLKNMPEIKSVSLYAFGEPLLNNNAGMYIEKISKLGKNITLSTNTTNLDKYTQELMLVDLLQFSIEGWDKKTYEESRKNLIFEETIERLANFDAEIKKRRAQNLKTPLRQIHCLFTKNTNFDEFIKVWGKYTDVIKFTPLEPYIRFDSEKNTSKLYLPDGLNDECFGIKRLKNVSLCENLKNEVAINSDGKAVLCCGDFSQHLDLGDYKDLKGIFNNKIRNEIIEHFVYGEPSICSACMRFFEVNNDEIKSYFPNLSDLKKYENENLRIVI